MTSAGTGGTWAQGPVKWRQNPRLRLRPVSGCRIFRKIMGAAADAASAHVARPAARCVGSPAAAPHSWLLRRLRSAPGIMPQPPARRALQLAESSIHTIHIVEAYTYMYTKLL